MDDILESVQFEEFFKTLETTMRLSAIHKACWGNPTAKMIVASQLQVDALVAGGDRWREENPEKTIAMAEQARVGAKKWREENPEEFLATYENLAAGGMKWREENPEKVRANYKKLRGGYNRWREENPEEWLAIANKGRAASHQGPLQEGWRKWREENPETVRANEEKAVAVLVKWREENPEEARALMEKYLWMGAAKWREENPDKVIAKLAKGRKNSAQSYARRYSERLQAIKAVIPKAGVSIYELQELFPQWNFDKLRYLLRKAVQRGDLDLIQVRQKHCVAAGASVVNRYTVPSSGPSQVQA